MTGSNRLCICSASALAFLFGTAGLAAQEVQPAPPPAEVSQSEPVTSPDGVSPGPVIVPEEPGLEPPPLPDVTPTDPTQSPDEPLPGDEMPPAPEPEVWTYRRAITTGQGENVHLRQRTVAGDTETMLREHSVTNPHGQHIQTWERSMTGEGYTYTRRHQFLAPDGTPLREHQMIYSGTDPYNYSRERTKTFRDGRTMTMTQNRTWDGESGTMERSFVGPNGQTRSFGHPWAPDGEPVDPQPVPMPEPLPAEPAAALSAPLAETTTSPLPDQQRTTSRWGFLAKLNPFRAISGNGWGPKTSPGPRSVRSGFTVGSAAQADLTRIPRGLAKKQPGQPQTNVHRMQVREERRLSHPVASRPKPHPNPRKTR